MGPLEIFRFMEILYRFLSKTCKRIEKTKAKIES